MSVTQDLADVIKQARRQAAQEERERIAQIFVDDDVCPSTDCLHDGTEKGIDLKLCKKHWREYLTPKE